MTVERTFIKLGMKRVELESFLEKELARAGYGGVDVRRIPTGTRVALYVERPGMVIGRKGKSIKQLTDDLEQKFGLEHPQVEVVEIPKPELSAPIMAKRIAFSLERGIKVRRACRGMGNRIMNAGARGVEIIVSGRIAGERSRRERFYQGCIKKSGEPAETLVSKGFAVAKLKPGVAGIKVRIMPPDVQLPDDIKIPLPDDIKIEPKIEPATKPVEAPQPKPKEEEEPIPKEGEEIGGTES